MTFTAPDPTLLRPSPSRCPACDGASRRTLGPVRYGQDALVADQSAADLVARLGRVDLVACDDCGYQWTDPRYSMDAVIALYRQNETTHWEAAGRDWNDHLRRLAPHLPPAGTALDIGCYTGDFLHHLGPAWDRHGVEPIPYAAGVARERGVTVFQGALDDANYPSSAFDLVTLWDVAEHLHDPLSAFQRARGWLKPGGLLALETGNAAAAVARFMGSDWWYVALLEHCGFFTPEAMRRLLPRAGFEAPAITLTRHHRDTPLRTLLQPAKAALYRAVSRGEARGASWVKPLHRLLLRRPPCLLGRDHLFVVARRPG